MSKSKIVAMFGSFVFAFAMAGGFGIQGVAAADNNGTQCTNDALAYAQAYPVGIANLVVPASQASQFAAFAGQNEGLSTNGRYVYVNVVAIQDSQVRATNADAGIVDYHVNADGTLSITTNHGDHVGQFTLRITATGVFVTYSADSGLPALVAGRHC